VNTLAKAKRKAINADSRNVNLPFFGFVFKSHSPP
jgi:hypothetical protein